MAVYSVYQKLRRALGNPTEDELPQEDLAEFFSQALLEYAYAIRHYQEITVVDGVAYDLSGITSILDVVYVADTLTEEPQDFTYDSTVKSLIVSSTGGTVKIIYVTSYTYDTIPALDKPYVRYLCMSFCLEEIADVRDRVPTLSSFRIVSGDGIRTNANRYLAKWERRFALSEVY